MFSFSSGYTEAMGLEAPANVTALSAALVAGLFVSTALTLIMVPVMVTAPTVIGAGAKRMFGRIGAFALPTFWLFEYYGPMIEMAGYFFFAFLLFLQC